MPLVIPVKFPFASRELWFDPAGSGAEEGDYVICRTERGIEFGLATADAYEVPAKEIPSPLKPVLHIASEDEIDRAEELAYRGDDAMPEFRRLIEKNGLDMKPVAVEYLFGGEKAVFYFAAEDRVDFRQLVKDLSSRFHLRVDMRQIGVRDETRLVGGFAHCGQELCCKRFGGNFEPVSIRMAKEQDLPLNSAKISGMCGRLMCCLRYEFEAYKDFKSRAPKKKAVIDTPLGKAKILEYDTPRERLKLRLESGKVFSVDLASMTCSEEACARAKEQGCACRPDTVTREALDAVESPDIALALLELDREQGRAETPGLSSADRLVSSPTPRGRSRRGEDASARGDGSGSSRTPRKRRRGVSSEDAQPAKHEQGRPEAEGGRTPRRRRRHLSSADREQAFIEAAGKAGAQAPDADGSSRAQADQGSSQRRRTHRSQGAPAEGAAASAGEQAERRAGSSRRRHKSASQRGAKPQQQGKPDVPSVAEQVASGEVHVRRRPGDRGGSRAVAPEVRAAGESRGERVPQGDATGQAPERRRRRRRRRSGGEGGSGSAGAGTAGAPQGGDR